MWEIINTYISATLLVISVLIFGKMILNRSISFEETKKVIFIEMICILQTLSFLCFQNTLKTIIMLINNALLYKCVFKISSQKSFFLSFLCMLLFIIVDMIELLLLTNLLGMNKIYYYNVFAASIIANMITCIIFLIITVLIRKVLIRIINTEISNSIKIALISIFTLISILLFGYSLVKKFKFSNDIIQYIVAISVLLFILFTLIKQTIEHNEVKREYDNLLEFMTTYENEIEKQRILRHETKNDFLTIRAKICDNQENKEIVSYIDEILKDKIKVKQEIYAKFGYLPPNGIKGLCYFKVQVAENARVKVALNISKRIKDSSIYSLNIKQQKEFGRILGVLLDNAIEASKESDKKQMGIEVYATSNKECKVIISNSFNERIDKNKIGKERFSTKGKNRGHGLLLVKHIIYKNKIFEINTSIQNDIYAQTITIKKV